MSADAMKVCFAGAGMISFYHLTAWSRVPGASVVGICDPALDRAQARAKEFGIPRVYPDPRAMLDAERPDAIDIASPVETHAEIVRLAAELGVQVMCQKPLTPTLAEAEALVRDVGERVRFMVHENRRFRPEYRQAGAWIRAGRIGRVVQCRLAARSSGLLAPDGGTPPFLKRQPFVATLPRFIIFEVLIHHLDIVRWLVGPLRVVAALTAQVSPHVRAEDAATVVMRGDDGRAAIVEGNLSVAGFPLVPIDRLEVVGTEGAIVYEREVLRLSAAREETLTFPEADAYQAAFTNAVTNFVEGVRTGAPFETDRLDNLETLRLVEAAYAAAGAAPPR